MALATETPPARLPPHIPSLFGSSLVRKGENVSAPEIERLLLAHPAIEQVAVVGLPDRERGELVCAVVVTKPGSTFDFAAMKQHLQEAGLAIHKFPERLEIVATMPLTGSGKVRKNALRESVLSTCGASADLRGYSGQ